MVKSCLASEQQEMMALIEWADIKSIPLVHHANEGARSARGGTIMKRMGLRPGFPDLSLNRAHGGYFGMFIELKKKCTYSPSQMRTGTWVAQRAWLTELATEHYYALMCFGQDHARKMIELYLSWPKTLFMPAHRERDNVSPPIA